VKYGIFGINFGVCADPQNAARVARAAEQAGFESLWTGEHVVLPDPQAPPSPSPPETPFLDPAVALAAVATHTTKVRLGTGIIILPQRNPLVLAKELATVDVVSGGRLIFGLGAGYLEPEFAALGVPFAGRGPRTDEYIEVMRALWTQEQPSFAGEHVSFAGIQAMPRPVQKPHPPIVVGGMSAAALRRAVARGDGWYGFALDHDATRACVAGLEEAAEGTPRREGLGPLEITVTPRGRLDAEAAQAYADLGVDRLVLLLPQKSVEAALEAIERAADDLSIA
jgi:probable F420-dependent oxidoreductase